MCVCGHSSYAQRQLMAMVMTLGAHTRRLMKNHTTNATQREGSPYCQLRWLDYRGNLLLSRASVGCPPSHTKYQQSLNSTHTLRYCPCSPPLFPPCSVPPTLSHELLNDTMCTNQKLIISIKEPIMIMQAQLMRPRPYLYQHWGLG